MRQARKDTRDNKPMRKVWHDPVLTQYDVDKVTAAIIGAGTDGALES